MEEVDPYANPVRVCNTHKPSPLGISISAASYVSDKTRKAFDDSLSDGFSLKGQVKEAASFAANTSEVNKPPSTSPAIDGSRLVDSLSLIHI